MLGWWRGASLRSRLIGIGSAGVTAGLALGGLILVQTLSYTLQRSLDQNATATAKGVAALVESGRLPDPIPLGGGASVIQVIGPKGGIVAASAGADRLVPALAAGDLAAARTGGRFTVGGERVSLDGPVRVVAERAHTPAGDETVLVALSARGVQESVGIVRTTLLVAFPLLVGVLAVVAWRVVGWTLRPVEQLRRGADEITGSRSDGRLPVPTGNDEVHRLAVTLNDMLARLDAARLRQRAFVADAAHELRSPLASMRTQTEVATLLGADADWAETASGLLADLDRLGRLTDDLLLLARADEAGRGTGDGVAGRRSADGGTGDMASGATEPVDLAALAVEVAGRYAGARVAVIAQVDTGKSAAPELVGLNGPAPLCVAGVPDSLRRVIANLLDNACRHATSRVVVTARREREDHASGSAGGDAIVLLTITDDGPGIPVADRERVFGRFTRLDDARARDDGGSGLGLAIVRELVRMHGGTVRLEDACPGVRAEVRLPAVL